jgi:DNA-binding NarL/FixJ family response regulator
VALRLFLSEKTVRNHVSAWLHKLQVASRAEAVAPARDAGLGEIR